MSGLELYIGPGFTGWMWVAGRDTIKISALNAVMRSKNPQKPHPFFSFK